MEIFLLVKVVRDLGLKSQTAYLTSKGVRKLSMETCVDLLNITYTI